MTRDREGIGQKHLLEKLAWAEQRGLPAEEEVCAVLFADIVGYSRVASRRGDAAALDLVRRFEVAASEAIGARGGRVVMTAGDAIMACWPSALLPKATRAAMTLSDRLRKDNRGRRRADRIHVRFGIHCGKVMRLQDGDLIGHGVNLACRIQTAALPDEILVSAEAAHAGQGREEMPPCQRLGLMRLKGVDDPVDIYRVGQEGRWSFRRVLADGASRAMNPSHWPVGSWVLFAIGCLLALGSWASHEFANPNRAALALWLCFLGWAMLWASYQPRTLSLWHPIVRMALGLAWLMIILPLGRLVGAW